MYYVDINGHSVAVTKGHELEDFISQEMLTVLPSHIDTLWKYWKYICSFDQSHLIVTVSQLLNKFFKEMGLTHVKAMELADKPIADILTYGYPTDSIYNLGKLLIIGLRHEGHDLDILKLF